MAHDESFAKKLGSVRTRGKKRASDLGTINGQIQELSKIVNSAEEDATRIRALREIARLKGLTREKIDYHTMTVEERLELMQEVVPVLEALGYEVEE